MDSPASSGAGSLSARKPAAASAARPSRAPSSASALSASASASSVAASSTAAAAASAGLVRLPAGGISGSPAGGCELTLARVKCAAGARAIIAAQRSAEASPASAPAARGAALLVPQSVLQELAWHAGQRAWATSLQHDGSRVQVHPLLQPVHRAATVYLRPLATRGGQALLAPAPHSTRMQEVMASVLSAVMVDRDVFVGGEVCVTLFDEEYAFSIDSIVPLGSHATAPSPSPDASDTNSAAFPFPPLFSVSPSTRVLLAPATPAATSDDARAVPADVLDVDAIGGLSSEIDSLRELLTLPLLQPHLFGAFGIRPPKGILLHGPPGTGKTMLARAVAQQTFSSFYLINGPEIVSKFVGESEEKLASVFAQARRHAPSIVFIDEIDSLCPKRDEGGDELQKRLVSSLLTLMDGIAGGGDGQAAAGDRVLVLGATNRPDSLDPALRRAGRFDREMEIGIPNETKRLDIMQRMIKNMPHDLAPQELTQVASVTHGYVGADLKAVCREAALVALSRWQTEQPDWMDRLGSSSSTGTDGASSSSPASHASLRLTHADFLSALPMVKPSALRSLVIDVPRVKWSDIGGQEDVKQKLREAVDWPLQHPEAFVRLGIQPPKGILLYGPPGCSKTLMAKALASESSRNFIAVKGPELFSKYVGESERALKELFRKARASAPSIVFFDEIDSIAASRGDGGGGSGDGGERVAHRVLSQLLTELDGIEPLKQVTILAATNRPDIIDAALLRPGRIDRILYVSPPDRESCAAILGIEFARIGPAAAGLDPKLLSARCVGLSGAEISALCREAALAAMEEDMHARTLEMRHFDAAFTRVTPRITPAMLAFYHNYGARAAVASV